MGQQEANKKGPLPRVDRLLIALLLPLWLVCLGFHIKEIERTGFAEPPIYAAASPDPKGYPTLGGFRMERGRGGEALEMGDVLIRVGETDLRGVGYLSFDAIALDEAGTSLTTPLVFERAGQRRTAPLDMLSSSLPLYRVVPVLSWVIVATLILVRARGANNSRTLFAATNVAARLQQLTRDLDAAVIVDATTWTAAREDARDWVHHGDSVIRGRSEPIDLYAVPLAKAATGAAGLLP